MTRLALRLTAALMAAVFLWIVLTLPPRPAVASGSVAEAIRARTAAGAVHIHSIRSDGAGDRQAIAAAAARTGLQFVVVTDHGDATRQPDPPAYVNGVLCIDAVEVSTNGGHVVALDMPVAPYPLGGEADAVIEDVTRLGGVAIAAHPDSRKPELAWADWTIPVAGLEWLSLDSAWRSASRFGLARVALHSLIRPGPALASLLDRPDRLLARWDEMASRTRVIGVAGHDTHGGVARPEEGSRWALPGASSYDASFAAFSTRVVLGTPLTGNAGSDARSVMAALRAGRVFTGVDAVAAPAWVDFHATLGSAEVQMGEERPFVNDSMLTVHSTAATGTTAVLLRNGAEVLTSLTGELQYRPSEPGAYRVELRHAGTRVPWVVTNPIYLREEVAAAAQTPSAGSATTALELPEPGVIEKDPDSSASLTPGASSRSVTFRLRGGERVSQYVALAVPLSKGLPPFDGIAFDARSSSPMRVSVQLRFEDHDGARWRRSIYVSPSESNIVVPIARLLAADRPGPVPAVSSASSLLFVVDLTNALPGAEGQFAVSRLRLVRLQ